MMLKNPSDGDEWRESNLALACDKKLRLIPANYSTVCRPVMSMPKLIRYAALMGQPHIEIDLTASHPRQILAYARRHGLAHAALQDAFGSRRAIVDFRTAQAQS